MPICTGCGVSKPLTEYGVDRHQASGRRSRCKQCCREATAAFRAANPTYGAEWQKSNPDKLAAYNARRDKSVSWHARYPETARAMTLRRRALRAGAPGTATPQQVRARMEYFGLRCWMCSGAYDAVDHVKPLSKGGSNWPANLRPICTPCNRTKGATWPLREDRLTCRSRARTSSSSTR